nr:sugar transport protein 13 [Tanacetum cinerariifolium]
MAGGGLAVTGRRGRQEFEAKVTPIVIILGIMAATGGLMFRYDVGVSGALLVVDTPNSLIERGKLEEGKVVLIKIRRTKNIKPEYLELVAASRIAKEVKHPFRNLLQRKNRPQLIIAVALQ